MEMDTDISNYAAQNSKVQLVHHSCTDSKGHLKSPGTKDLRYTFISKILHGNTGCHSNNRRTKTRSTLFCSANTVPHCTRCK